MVTGENDRLAVYRMTSYQIELPLSILGLQLVPASDRHGDCPYDELLSQLKSAL